MKPVLDFIIKYRVQIIILILVIIAIILIKKNWYRVRKFMNPQEEEKVPENLADNTTQTGLSQSRVLFIEQVASDIYNDIEETPWYGHNYDPYDKALGMYDDEIKYMGKYYRDFLTGGQEKMSDAINSQTYTWSSSPLNLRTKLLSYSL